MVQLLAGLQCWPPSLLIVYLMAKGSGGVTAVTILQFHVNKKPSFVLESFEPSSSVVVVVCVLAPVQQHHKNCTDSRRSTQN